VVRVPRTGDLRRLEVVEEAEEEEEEEERRRSFFVQKMFSRAGVVRLRALAFFVVSRCFFVCLVFACFYARGVSPRARRAFTFFFEGCVCVCACRFFLILSI
jgi:hypothetical protein